MMVNDDFKREIKSLFLKGFEETISSFSNDSNVSVREKSQLDNTPNEEFFVLTVSSQLFRIIVLVHFTNNESSRSFVSDALKIGQNGMSDLQLYDFLGELGNSFCGALKRDLGKTVPHLGMSTPNVLSKDCLKYMQSLKIDHEMHASAEVDGNILFCASAYLSADQALHYEIKSNHEQEETDSGELEFF